MNQALSTNDRIASASRVAIGRGGQSVIDTPGVVVQAVLEQAEPYRPTIFRFMRLDAPE